MPIFAKAIYTIILSAGTCIGGYFGWKTLGQDISGTVLGAFLGMVGASAFIIFLTAIWFMN